MLLVSIYVDFDQWGRMGNRMFQYAFGYILANEKKTKLYSTGLPNFNIQPSILDRLPQDAIYTRSFGDNYVDLDLLLNTDKDIVVNSFVQKTKYYLPYREELRNLFGIKTYPTIDDGLVLHIRETDYIQINQFLGYEFYKELISFSGFKNIVIVTDNSECETVKKLLNDGCTLYSKGVVKDFSTTNDSRAMNDFNYLVSSNNIALSQSSFSWWAAFLGAHSKVIFPFKQQGGQWLLNPGHDNSDLYLDTISSIKFVK